MPREIFILCRYDEIKSAVCQSFDSPNDKTVADSIIKILSFYQKLQQQINIALILIFPITDDMMAVLNLLHRKESLVYQGIMQENIGTKANEVLVDHLYKSASYTPEASDASYTKSAAIVKEASTDIVDDAVYRDQLVIASLKKVGGLSEE
ncbi:hypothetical protein FACS1894170_06690 [Planctomycetales bacterium]|nr:hypothetical protein FACS1894170_06690 [Planctomycetales bacterium]